MRRATITLSDICVDVVLGVYEHEQSHAQPLVLDVSYQYDMHHAVAQDDIAQAVCYDKVRAAIVAFIGSSRFRLLETLVERLSAHLYTLFPTMRSLELTIDKPNAMPDAFVSIHYQHSDE